MESLVANLGGKVRRVTHNGREYLVAPLSMINPGVLNGSKGALYYPPEEVAKNYQAWNGMPIVVNHPFWLGQPISAHAPEVRGTIEIGEVRNSRVKQKLHAEGWFDVVKTQQLEPRIYSSLVQGKAFELSTGLYTDNEEAPPNSSFNGKPYTHIARNYRPDHLAVLPDQKGACSINDGCGVLVNSMTTPIINANPEGINQYSKSAGTAVKLSKKANAASTKAENTVDGEKKANSKAADAHIAARNAHNEAASKATNANDVRAHKQSAAYHATSAHSHLLKAGRDTRDATNNSSKGVPMDKAQTVNWLTTNCDCWKNEGDATVLNGMPLEKLTALKTTAEEAIRNREIAEAATKGFRKAGRHFAFNAEKGVFTVGDAAKIVATANAFSNDDDSSITSSDMDDSSDLSSTVKRGKKSSKKDPATTNMSLSEFISNHGTPQEQAVWNCAVAVEKRERSAIVQQLIANSSLTDPKQKKAMAAKLMTKDLADLQERLLLQPATNRKQTAAPAPAPIYAGDPASYSTTTTNSGADEGDVLGLPTINWEEWANSNK